MNRLAAPHLRVLLSLGLGAASCGGDGSPADAPTSAGAPSGTTAEVDPDGSTTAASSGTDGWSDGSSDGSGTGSSGGTDTTGPSVLAPAIGLVQYNADLHFGEYDHNLAQLTAWAELAVERGARIIVFPEGSSHGYASSTELWCAPGMDSYDGRTCRDVSAVAEPLPGGPTTAYWSAFAQAHDVAVIFHVPEVADGEFYTSLGVVGPQGFVSSYRKRSLYYVDQAYASAGQGGTIVDTPWGRFGLMICLDGTYDGGYYDEYLANGVDGIIISMDWDDDPEGSAAAITWFRERADVNGVMIYASDVSTWDGTGLYRPGDVPRERIGLPPVAVDVDGVSVHPLE